MQEMVILGSFLVHKKSNKTLIKLNQGPDLVRQVPLVKINIKQTKSEL